MLEVVYYIIEALKFFIIYKIGFAMSITNSNMKKILAVLITLAMGVLMNFFKMSIMYPFLYIAFALSVFYLIFGRLNIKSIIIVLWASGVILSVDTISYVLLRLIINTTNKQLEIYQVIIVSLITIVVLLIMFCAVGYKKKAALQELSFWYFLAFLLICIVNSVVLILVEKEFIDVHGEFTLIYVLLVLSSLIQMAFVLVLSSSSNWHRKNEELKERYLELQIEHYQCLEEKNQETKKFRHDIRAHMLVIKHFINEKQWSELENYTDVIFEEFECMPRYISVKNGCVDAILNYYSEQFMKRECKFKVVGNLPQNCYLQAYDLCIIFSNILSNALEAATRSEEKYVELSIHFDENMIYIREKNTYSGNAKREGGKILSNKTNSELHGFGISNIKDSVKKYSGNVDVEFEKENFLIDIVMDNKEPSGGKN